MSNKTNTKLVEQLAEEYQELGGHMENIDTSGSTIEIINQLQRSIIKIKNAN